MSNLKLFMHDNRVKRENVKHVATESLVDENGKALEWEIRHLSGREVEELIDCCTKDVAIEGEKGQYKTKFDSSEYALKLIVRSVVVPDLYNKELQDSYGVTTPEELVKELIDSPSEYMKFAEYIQKLNEFDSDEEDIEEAKKVIESDAMAGYAHYCLHKLNILPSVFLALSRKERNFIIASIQIKTEKEKEEYEKF